MPKGIQRKQQTEDLSSDLLLASNEINSVSWGREKENESRVVLGGDGDEDILGRMHLDYGESHKSE